jgi:hypothetical protein
VDNNQLANTKGKVTMQRPLSSFRKSKPAPAVPAAVAQRTKAPPAEPGPAPPASAAEPAKREPGTGEQSKQKIKQQCGHVVAVVHLETTDCPACFNKRRLEKRLAKQAAQVQRREQESALGRLPDGAEYVKRYDAATQTWTATLTVNGVTLTHTADGSFRVESELDRIWRASAGAARSGE